MCPLVKSDVDGGSRVSLQAWKDGEEKELDFLDNGRDMVGQYGLTFVYRVKEFGDPEGTLFVRPNSPLAIGLQSIVNEHGSLKGLKISITKSLGERPKDTRYNCKVV